MVSLDPTKTILYMTSGAQIDIAQTRDDVETLTHYYYENMDSDIPVTVVKTHHSGSIPSSVILFTRHAGQVDPREIIAIIDAEPISEDDPGN